MIDLGRLRQRLMAATAFPMAGAALSACPAPQTREDPNTPHKPNWVMRWCGDKDDANERALDSGGAHCPVSLERERFAKEYPDRNWININGMTMIHFEIDANASRGDDCCYDVYNDPPPPDFLGRPLMAGRAPVVARPVRGAAWARVVTAELTRERAESVPATKVARRYLAAAWTRDALAEHASVASFARTTLELLAVGAPPELVRGASQAALDEVRHAELCFGLARALGAADTDPGPLTPLGPRRGGLGRLARDTFLEGCVAETAGAVEAAQQHAHCEDPAARAVLAEIAPDEARHAELAWATLAWLVARGGDGVRRAVVRAARELPTWAPRGVDAIADAPDVNTIHTHGRLGQAERRAMFETTVAELIVPLAANLGIDLAPTARARASRGAPQTHGA